MGHKADGLGVMQPGCRTFTIKCGYNHYKVLMEKFPLVVHVFLSLEPQVSVEGSQNLPKESSPRRRRSTEHRAMLFCSYPWLWSNHDPFLHPLQFQEAIADITKRMGEGMAEFIVKDVSQTCSQWPAQGPEWAGSRWGKAEMLT